MLPPMTMIADEPASTSPDNGAHARPRIFVSVAEQSADEHAAILARAFMDSVPDARFEGLAGPALRAEGVDDRLAFAGGDAHRVLRPHAAAIRGATRRYTLGAKWAIVV